MHLSLLRTARFQLGIVLIGLLLLAGVTALTTYAASQHHSQDYVGMDLIDTERDLAEQLSWLALADPQNPEFIVTENAFQSNLYILHSGGTIVLGSDETQTIPTPDDPRVLEELKATFSTWQTFRRDAREVWSLPLSDTHRSTAIGALRQSMPAILRDLTNLHIVYEQQMEADVSRMNQIQQRSLLFAIPLLFWGYIIIRRRIVRPAAVLAAAAHPADSTLHDPYLRAEAYTDELQQLLPSLAITRPEIGAAARLVELQISERTRLLMSAFKFSQEIVGELALNQLLKLVTDKSMQLLGAHSAAIYLSETETTQLELLSAQGIIATGIRLHQPAPHGLQAQPDDALPASNIAESCERCTFREACESASWLSTQLLAGTNVIGSLCVIRTLNQPFSNNDQRALDLLGSVAAVAISNAQLAESSRFDAQQSAVLAERKRLTAEIHDNIAQTLSYLGLQVEHARDLIIGSESDQVLTEIEHIQSAAHDAYNQVRMMLNSLAEPAPSTNTHLLEALSAFGSDFRRVTGLELDVRIDHTIVNLLSPLAQTQMLTIIREALTNVHRHAKATQASVRAWHTQGHVSFTIQDNGIGFDRLALSSHAKFGLAIMQARAERCGGTLVIHSEPGKGTTVSASFPSLQSQITPIELKHSSNPTITIPLNTTSNAIESIGFHDA